MTANTLADQSDERYFISANLLGGRPAPVEGDRRVVEAGPIAAESDLEDVTSVTYRSQEFCVRVEHAARRRREAITERCYAGCVRIFGREL